MKKCQEDYVIKVICVGGGKAKSVPEVRPPRPERVPVFDDLLKLAQSVEDYRYYAEAVENLRSLKSKNWRRIVNNSRVVANRVHRELDKAYLKWRKMG